MMSTLKDVGYKTYWISNQPGAGYGSMVSFWSTTVDNSKFLNTRDYRIGYDFDEVLLPNVELALKETAQSKVIVVHMMGSHPGYEQRYPRQFQHWSDVAEVPNSVSRKQESSFNRTKYNTYDNSLLYSDYILSSIVSTATKYNVASIVYFSDHGQSLGEKSAHVGHSTSHGPRQGFEVPLMFWLNTSELNQLNLGLVNFKSNLEKPFSLERLQYTLFDLYGVQLPTSSSGKSLFSSDYQVTKRDCDGMKY
jgi:heptose-I-phosphate ethanolaminephosphotransferase